MKIDLDACGYDHLTDIASTLATDRPPIELSFNPAALRAAGGTPSTLHRLLARLGYVPRVVVETPEHEEWVFYHPDGERL